MKKIIIGIISFLLFPLCSLAINYDIKNFYIDANVLENGDMEVKELIVLKGTFNGYERDIAYRGINNNLYNASGITNLKISAKEISGDISFATLNESFETFKKVDFSNNGTKGEYVESLISGGYRYRMYYFTNKAKTAFLIEYTLKDVAIIHNDCAEIYWNFIGDAFEDPIENLNIRITLPKKDNSIRWWFHGDLAGNSALDESSSTTRIVASLDNNAAYSAVDSRILFDKSLVNEEIVTKKDRKDVLESITAYEDEIVRKDLERIAYIKKMYTTAVVLTVAYFIVLVLVWIHVYFKFDKERTPSFQNEYNREFIDDYNVEVIDYLMNKNITSNAMSASIMNLIYKKNISYEEIVGVSGKKDYQFTLVTRDNLNETENLLVDFLFQKIGKDNVFTTSGLKKYASSTRTCDTFMSSYTAWNNQVLKDGKKEEFFETGVNKALYGIVIFLFALIIIGFVAGNDIYFFPAFFTVFAAVIFIIYLCASTKKTQKGIEHYARWKAFKKFLNDFGTFELKELPEIELWERYLVYATIFGLADKVEKAMNVKIQEIGPMEGYNSIYIHNHTQIAPIINSSVRSAYNGAQTAITRAHANASGGSFGGGGGGFSSGGGFGGGGGGGRGF